MPKIPRERRLSNPFVFYIINKIGLKDPNGNQKPKITAKTMQRPKEKGQKDKQLSIKP